MKADTEWKCEDLCSLSSIYSPRLFPTLPHPALCPGKLTSDVVVWCSASGEQWWERGETGKDRSGYLLEAPSLRGHTGLCPLTWVTAPLNQSLCRAPGRQPGPFRFRASTPQCSEPWHPAASRKTGCSLPRPQPVTSPFVKSSNPKRYMHPCVHSNTIHNSRDTETT